MDFLPDRTLIQDCIDDIDLYIGSTIYIDRDVRSWLYPFVGGVSNGF